MLEDLFGYRQGNCVISTIHPPLMSPTSKACIQNLQTAENLSCCLRDASDHHYLVLEVHACQPQSVPALTHVRARLPQNVVERTHRGHRGADNWNSKKL